MKRTILWAALVLSSCTATPAFAQTVSGCGTAAIPKADVGNKTKLTVQADCFAKAKIVASDAEANRRERIKAIGAAPAPISTPAPVPLPTTRPSIGISAVPVSYYGTERIWANLAYRASEWMTVVGGVNTQGNPNTSGRIFLMAPNAVLNGGSARITCTWRGGGRVYITGTGATYGDHTASTTWTAAGPPGKHGGIWIDLSDSDGTFRDLDCREPGVVTNGRLDQRYVDDMKLYSVVRFLDWSNANSNAPSLWASRPLPGQQITVWTGDQPIEDQIEIANAVGADAWFTIPWNADDAYVRGLATLVRDTLKGKAYFETGNEVWNWMFPVTTQALNEGVAKNLSPNKWDNTMLRYDEKTVEQNRIVTDVFKAQPARLVRVASFQSGNVPGIDQFLGFRDTARWVDAIADAPYFGVDELNSQTPVTETQPQLFARLEKARLAMLQTTTFVAQAAKRHGKLSMIYEGGQSNVSTEANAAVNEEMQRSPLMEAAYDRYLADLRAVHTGPIMLYNTTGPTGRFGSWGQHEFTGQPAVVAPKRRAIAKAVAQR